MINDLNCPQNELEGALNGIFLLHETYDLNLTAFSLGQIEVPGQPGKILQSNQQVKNEQIGNRIS